MSAPPKSRGEPITDKRQLVDYLAAGCKPRADWRIGTEHEKFAFNLKDLRTLPYDGAAGIRAVRGRSGRMSVYATVRPKLGAVMPLTG